MSEKKKYEFVRFKDKAEGGKTYPTWWFVARTIDDVYEHYNKYLLPTMQVGYDGLAKSVIEKIFTGVRGQHANNIAQSTLKCIACGKFNTGEFDLPLLPTFELANNLLLEAVSGRIKDVIKGEIYLEEGLRQFGYSEGNSFYEIAETYYSDELVYPDFETPTLDDVRFIQWTGGRHWYAKIGNVDVVDLLDRQKWDTKAEAEKAALWYIKKHYTKKGRENHYVD